MTIKFQVEKNNLANIRTIKELRSDDLEPGTVLIRIERFALTANNITYGLTGDKIGYWKFFPAEAGWGHIPVWGIGRVVQSEHTEVDVDARYFGYFPMSSDVVFKPEDVSDRGFGDGAVHRSELPTTYNQYSLVSRENGFDPASENHAMLYRPLFMTSFVLDDYLADNDFFGAQTVILGSASSKTAIGLAFLLHARDGVNVIGLTSVTNKDFVRGLGLYDEVLAYEDVESLPQDRSVYVDMAGNRPVLARIHHHLQDKIVNSCGVGATHWEAREGESPRSLPGARPTMFFAPGVMVKRSKELGAAEYQRQISQATAAFLAQADRWVTIEEHPFREIETVYLEVLAGASPNRGYIVTC